MNWKKKVADKLVSLDCVLELSGDANAFFKFIEEQRMEGVHDSYIDQVFVHYLALKKSAGDLWRHADVFEGEVQGLCSDIAHRTREGGDYANVGRRAGILFQMMRKYTQPLYNELNYKNPLERFHPENQEELAYLLSGYSAHSDPTDIWRMVQRELKDMRLLPIPRPVMGLKPWITQVVNDGGISEIQVNDRWKRFVDEIDLDIKRIREYLPGMLRFKEAAESRYEQSLGVGNG